MPKTRAQKAETIKSVREKLDRARSVVFALHERLSVKDTSELKRLCKKEGVDYTVIKKTLLKKAFAEAGFQINPKEISGNFATVIGYEDEVAPARILSQFGKTHEVLKIIGGVLEKKFTDKSLILQLAALPSKQELRRQLLGSLNAPISGLVNVLAGNLRGLLFVLSAIKDSKI